MSGGDMEKGTVINRLIGWARWKMNSGAALGYPSKVSFMQLGGGGSPSGDSYTGVDAWCKETDAGVELLNPHDRDMIRMEYIELYQQTAVKAYKMGLDKRTYYRHLLVAYQSLGEKIENNLHTCHKSSINTLELQNVATN